MQLFEWFFPKMCCSCHEISDKSIEICSYCYQQLPWLTNVCYRCGSTLLDECETLLCLRCQEKPPSFDKLCALFHYEPPLTKFISRLKFSSDLSYGRILGEIMAEHFLDWYKNDSLPKALLPVPLSPDRFKKRGFNQSIELMRPIINRHAVSPLYTVCKKIKHTKPQSELDKEMRHQNLQGVFHVVNTKEIEEYDHIAIVDDVVTTASTVKALAHLLKNHGVERVDVVCCCRA